MLLKGNPTKLRMNPCFEISHGLTSRVNNRPITKKPPLADAKGRPTINLKNL